MSVITSLSTGESVRVHNEGRLWLTGEPILFGEPMPITDIDTIVAALKAESISWSKENPPEHVGVAQLASAVLAGLAFRLAAASRPGSHGGGDKT